MYERERDTAIEIARRAGAAVLELYAKQIHVEYKHAKEPVTEADLASNEVIVSALRASFPDDAILSEEAKDSDERLAASRVWVIDPIDGTKEYIDRNGQFAIMIGLAVDGEAVVGVVFQPVTGRLWAAAGLPGAAAGPRGRQGGAGEPLGSRRGGATHIY